MSNKKQALLSESGYVVVEAAILFPIIFMIIFGLIILAMYLPTRASLQYATQTAATMLSSSASDTWVSYDESKAEYRWISSKKDLPNVYVALASCLSNKKYSGDDAKKIVKYLDEKAPTYKPKTGEIEVYCTVTNFVVYKEITVTARRDIKSPINLSFVGMPTTIPVICSSTSVVKNGDEFVRNVDLAVDIVERLREKYQSVDKIFNSLEKVMNTYNNFFGD